MTINIDIPNAKVVNFSNQAKEELKAQISDISQKLVDEALRVESSERLKGDKQEVTSSVVQKSAELFLKRYKSKNRKGWRMCVDIISTVFITFGSIGIKTAYDDLQNHSTLLFFAFLLFVIGIIAYVISIKEKYE